MPIIRPHLRTPLTEDFLTFFIFLESAAAAPMLVALDPCHCNNFSPSAFSAKEVDVELVMIGTYQVSVTPSVSRPLTILSLPYEFSAQLRSRAALFRMTKMNRYGTSAAMKSSSIRIPRKMNDASSPCPKCEILSPCSRFVEWVKLNQLTPHVFLIDDFVGCAANLQ